MNRGKKTSHIVLRRNFWFYFLFPKFFVLGNSPLHFLHWNSLQVTTWNDFFFLNNLLFLTWLWLSKGDQCLSIQRCNTINEINRNGKGCIPLTEELRTKPATWRHSHHFFVASPFLHSASARLHSEKPELTYAACKRIYLQNEQEIWQKWGNE